MNVEKNTENKERLSYFIIIILPNVLFFIVLGIICYLFMLYDLPWILFPESDITDPMRLIELINSKDVRLNCEYASNR